MGRGKEWSKDESLHLAQSWVAVSEGEGAERVIGTNQSLETFWRGVMNVFSSKAPHPTPPGTYGHREWTALKAHWAEQLSRDVKKFRKSLNRVYARNLSGVSEQDKINIAVVMHRGITDAPDYRYAGYDPTMWKFYDCWLFLRNHPAFAFVNEQSQQFNQSQSSNTPSTLSLDADDSIDLGSVSNENENMFATPTEKPQIFAKSRGPGPGITKTKSQTIDDEYKKKRIKFNDEFLQTLNQRQKTYSNHVSAVQRNQKFRNAAIAYELFKDSDPDEAEKYKNLMANLMMEGQSDTTNDNENE